MSLTLPRHNSSSQSRLSHTNTLAALLWTHYHATICRLFEPTIYIRPLPIGTHDAQDGTARTTALWSSLTAARDYFAALTTIPPQNLPCLPFVSAHLSFCTITVVRLVTLDADPDWNPAVARDAVDFDGALNRVAELFDLADKSCGPGGAGGNGRRARYVDLEGHTALSAYRDKVRWIRDWYLARCRPGGAAAARYQQQTQQPYYRGGEADAGGGAAANKEQVDGGGGAMEVDYGALQQAQDAAVLPGGEMLDEGFWQAMFDWSWNAPAMDFPMEVQS